MNNDLISREALKKAIEELRRPKAYSEADVRQNVVVDCVLHCIDNAPTVDIKDQIAGAYNEGYMCGSKEAEKARPQGEWKFVFDDKVNNRFIYKCSECGREVSVYSSNALIPVYPFCHCGAKMLEGGDKE